MLIFDEIMAGFRMNVGGAHLLFGIDPDIAVFAKAMSNGFPMAAVIGREEVMQVSQESFISSTYWTDRIGPAAALATIKKFKERDVAKHLDMIGKLVQAGWEAAASKHGLKIEISGIYPLGHFNFVSDQPLVLKTLFTQFILEEGCLATNAFYASFAHSREAVEKYMSATDRVFAKMAKIIDEGDPARSLKGPVCYSGFKRLT